MEGLLAVARYTLKEHIRNRVYLTVILFGAVLLIGSVIISALAVEEQVRMMLDVGLAGIEFLSLITILFVTVNLVLEEMETRSIYLILSHPLPRWQYIVGRFLGTLTALVAGILIMAVLHVLSLLLYGWEMQAFYPVALFCSICKISVVGALALFVSLITTSTASSMCLTGFLWVLGHFISEMQFMATKSGNLIVKIVVDVLRTVTPNFSYFNYRDFWQAAITPAPVWFGWMTAYTFAYIGVSLFLASWIFSRKEF